MKKWTYSIIASLLILLPTILQAQSNCWTFNSVNGTWINNCTTGTPPPFVVTTGKQVTFKNSLVFLGTDNAQLNVGQGGALGSAAYANSNQFQPAGGGGNSSFYYAGSLTIGTGVDYINITGSAGLSFSPAMWVLCAYVSDPTQFMYGYIDTYNTSTGAIKITIPTLNSTGGSGSYTGWNISVAGAIGPIGATGSGSSPAGTIIAFGGSSTPSNHLPCDGTAISRATYSTLFSAIGTTWGAGDGSTTFNLPNLNGRFPLGDGTGQTAENGGSGTARTLGQYSNGTSIKGAETHTQSANEMAVHSHSINDPGHAHGNQVGAPGAQGLFIAQTTNGGSNVNTEASYTGITINNAGGGAAASVMNPFAVVKYFIRYQ